MILFAVGVIVGIGLMCALIVLLAACCPTLDESPPADYGLQHDYKERKNE